MASKNVIKKIENLIRYIPEFKELHFSWDPVFPALFAQNSGPVGIKVIEFQVKILILKV